MISTAHASPSITKSGEPVEYAVGPAEELDQISFLTSAHPLEPASIDLITCAMSAHWFSPISSFYSAASRLLRPGGTLAMWTASSYYCQPHTTPNAEKVQAILVDLERRILRPFELPGNRLSMDGYENLPLPWEGDAPVLAFEESSFVRKEWNLDGKVERGQRFLALQPRHSLDDLAKGCSTASMVVRWREAHKDQIERGEVEDCIDCTVRRLKEALDGQDWMEGGPSTVLLIIKKKA
jgi:SAM-dependent methyltransferase